MKSLLILFAYASFASMQYVFRQFEWYRALYGQFPFYVPETIKVGAGLAVCVAAATWMYVVATTSPCAASSFAGSPSD